MKRLISLLIALAFIVVGTLTGGPAAMGSGGQPGPGAGNGQPPSASMQAGNVTPARSFTGLKGAPSSSRTAARLLSGPYYNYMVGAQNFTTNLPTIVQANSLISNPYMNASDSCGHTLMEIAGTKTEASGNHHIFEAGWRKACGDSGPKMFVFSWVNEVPQGYGTGFVNYFGSGASAYHPGDDLTSLVGVSKQFGWQYNSSTGSWWLYFDGGWVGYYPSSQWSPYTFIAVDKVQAFAEVASYLSATPCIDAGDGNYGTSTAGAYWSSVTYNTGATAPNLTWGTVPSGISAAYTIYALSGRSARMGGPGWNSAGTGAGTKGSC